MKRKYIESVLINQAEYSEERVNNMSKSELLDKWLQWEGICGYTYTILHAIEDLWDINLEY